MSRNLKFLLSRLALPEHKDGLELDAHERRVAVGGTDRNWIDWVQACGVRLYFIRDEGREALNAIQQGQCR